MKNVLIFFAFLLLYSCSISQSSGFQKEKRIAQNKVKFQIEDNEIFKEKVKWSRKKNLSKLPFNEVIIEISKSFLGSPYEAYTLDQNYPEKLVVNIRSFDCLTFLENVLALSLIIKSNSSSFSHYQSTLYSLRYRGGSHLSYSSRLHYYTDWLLDAEKKNFLFNIQGPDRFKKELNILSKNTKRKNEINKIKKTENILQERTFNYFSCKTLETINLDNILQNGDIIAFTSNLSGLDVNHVAFAYKDKAKWTYIDATSVNKKEVEIYPGSIIEYCNKVKTNTGIMIARPIFSK
ncbi:MAG: DUF1460 domain-containing protein [Candidatus Caenarcaniphilales bacterium]|nr:DUF1460 domain-containing protein [Candidatus Caenarcaniphilales bacterium]